MHAIAAKGLRSEITRMMRLKSFCPVYLLAATVLSACGDSSGPGGGGTPPPPPPGSAFITYAGGSNDEMARDIAVDGQGNFYVAGSTYSPNFPTTAGAYDRSFNQSGAYLSDAFIMKLSPSGQLIWSTLLGGPNFERVYAIEVDAQGYVYVAGRAGAGFPTTAGVLQPNFGGGPAVPLYGPQDGFVCKLTPNGASVVFCTYFGNDDSTPIRDLALGPGGDIWIITSTDSSSFPSAWFTGGYQSDRRGGRDVVVARISGDGSRVVWATYLGGSGEEANTNSIRVDASGAAFVGLFTHSADMPTPNGFDQSLGGVTDIYAGRLSADGSSLLFGTFVGGSGVEDTETHQIEIDGAGNVFVVGQTTSSDFPVTPGAFQKTAVPGERHAFVAKVSPGGSLLAATYLGGNGAESAEGVAVDAQGNVNISGATSSSNFPLTVPGNAKGGDDMYFAEFSPDLASLLYSTRIGGTGQDRGRSLVMDAQGGAIVVGHTTSSNLPVRNAIQPSLAGQMDALIAKLKP